MLVKHSRSNMERDSSSSTVSIIDSSSGEKRYFFGANGIHKNSSSNDADISHTDCERELTPGSLQIWLDLPEEIKHDPLLAPFKRLYEETHGKMESSEIIEDNELSDKNSQRTEKCENKLLENLDCAERLMEPMHVEKEKKIKTNTKIQLAKILRVIKLCVLVASWVLLTVSLLLNRERDNTVLHTALNEGEIKEYSLPINKEGIRVQFTLTGPFNQAVGNDSDSQLQLWLHRRIPTDSGEDIQQNSTKWIVYIQPEENLDFAPSVTETRTLILDANKLPAMYKKNENRTKNILQFFQRNQKNNGSTTTLRMRTTCNATVPLTITYHLDPLDEDDGIIYSLILLLTLYILIIFEIVNRTIAALLSSSLAVAVLALNGARPSLPELVSWLDVETLLLLFSMMLLVAILAETGLFDRLAVLAFEVTGGNTWPLINCLCIFTAFFSTFLDNVTTVLLMTPVTIRLCEVMHLNPVPVLMSMVIFSNVGGAATPVGDPPNVIIASQPFVLRENINFTSFTLHMGVGILLICVQTYIQLRYMFRDNKLRHTLPSDIQEMRQEIAVWKKAAASLASYSKDEDIVRRALEKKVDKLSNALARREAGGGGCKADPAFCSTLAHMKQKYRIRDKQLLIKSATCVLFVVIVFFLHAIPELQRLSLGWTALLGALLLLLLAERDDLEPILARVEWSTLLFFAALFVLMEALSKLGLISWIGRMTEAVILQVNQESRLAVAIMLILWVSGLASAFVDNIPLTTMMVRVIAALAHPDGLALPLAPLTWALSFGACLGGNGTLIGASANVVCAGVAEQHGYRFTFMEYLKIGFPIMIGNLLVASVYLLICHCVIQWH